MLNSPHRKLAASLALVVLAIACAHHVDQRPNEPVGADVAQLVDVSVGKRERRGYMGDDVRVADVTQTAIPKAGIEPCGEGFVADSR